MLKNDRKAGSASGLDFLGVTLAVFAGLVVLATLNWQFYHQFPMPIHDDMFDRLRFYRAVGGARALFDYLISAHNEHRVLTTRLVTMFDEHFVRGREYVQVIATNLFQLGSAFVVYRAIVVSQGDRAWSIFEKGLAFATIALLFINPNFLYTLIVPFQLQHAIMTFICVLGAWFVSRASGTPSTSATSAARLLAVLIPLAFVGTFTLGNAPVILIAAAASAIVLRWSPVAILIVTTSAAIHLVTVLATTASVGTRSYDFVAILKFTVIYLGAPFVRFGPWPAGYATWWSSVELTSVLGSVVLATVLMFGIARLLKPGLGGRVAIFGFVILVIVIVTGFAAGLSRAQFGILEAANKKYASFAALGSVGVLAIASGVVRDLFESRAWSRSVLFASMLVVVLPMATFGYARETRIWQKMIERNWEAASAVFAKVGHRDVLRNLYTEESSLTEYIGYIESRGRGIFSYFPFRWGDDIEGVLAQRREVRCRSEVQTIDRVSATDLTDVFRVPGTPVSISGSTWMTDDRAPPATVVALDGSNRVLGVARITRTSARIEEWLGQKVDQSVGWYGYARLIDSSPVTFIALSNSRRSYCKLGGLGNSR